MRIGILIPVAIFAHLLGFYGVLIGMGAAELAGMLFMLFALTKAFHVFDPKALLKDTAKVAVATLTIVAAGICFSALRLSTPFTASERIVAAAKAGWIGLAILISAYPAFRLSGLLSKTESRSVLAAIGLSRTQG